jgi:chromosome segregation ATPase
MIDRIELLEEKIAALLQKVGDTRGRIGDLQRQNRELVGLLEQKDQTDSDNNRLQDRIRELEAELNARDDKENTVKDRLKAILNRIDTLESEILELDNNQVE